MKSWLPIKQEYLIENFDNLLQYLQEADFESQSGFFRETIERLEEVAYGILEDEMSHKLGITNNQDEHFERNLKIVLASIYASFKLNRDINELLILLLDTLTVNQMFEDEDSLQKIKDIIINLANDIEIHTLPYNLKELTEEDFSTVLFVKKLLGLTFQEGKKGYLEFESKGSCIFDGDKIKIDLFDSRELAANKVKTLDKIGLQTELRGEEKKINEKDFKDQVLILNRILQNLSRITPRATKKLKEYTIDDEIYVEVRSINRINEWVKCRSINPDYKPLELYLNLWNYFALNPKFQIYRSDFVKELKEGDILKVTIEKKDDGKYYFNLNKGMKEFYDTYEIGYQCSAIFSNYYKEGSTWLTELGHLVNIKSEPEDQEIHEVENEQCDAGIRIEYKEKGVNQNGLEIFNGKRVGEIERDVKHQEFVRQVQQTFIEELIGQWKDDCPTKERETNVVRSIDEVYIHTLAHLYAMRAEDLSVDFNERYLCEVASLSLSMMLDNEHDATYSEYSLGYLRALWAFAQDSGHEWLHRLPAPDSIKDLELIRMKDQTIAILGTYKENSYSLPASFSGRPDVERINTLVEASNNLIGNIAPSEINRIKRTISKSLGIESIHKEAISEKHWFGEENDMLEFKTSIVFPPQNKINISQADPNNQIWAILKTINGFLNSLHGGTLLIGVNDFGNAIGVDDDIKWLYDNGKINSDDADRYLQYIKYRADNAFEAFKRQDRDNEITSMRVSYNGFKVEGLTVFRIDIKPYELGCVRMKKKITFDENNVIRRPDYIKDAYVRNASTTEELTDSMRQKIEEEKKSIIKDVENQNHITVQEAIESGKYLRLKDYHSANGEEDKTIEPLELLPQRGLVVGVVKGEKSPKVFKLRRCEKVEILDEDVKKRLSRINYSVDPFNMLSTGGKHSMPLRLRLDRLAGLLLMEMYPYSRNIIKRDKKDDEYPYLLKCEISDVMGAGSFCMSVIGHFKIESCEPLEKYIREKCEEGMR